MGFAMIRFASCCLIVTAIFCSAGCAEPGAGVRYKAGIVDPKTQNLVAFWIQYRDRAEEPFVVTDPLAVLTVWCSYGKRFFIYDNIKKQIYKTTDFEKFLQQLNLLPRNVSIPRISKCAASFSHDMPADQAKRLQQVMEKGGRKWAPTCFTACTCESSGLRFP